MAQQRQLATPAYLVGLALMCIPPFDALMQVFPFRFGDARWRFGFFGLMSNALMIPLTGLLVVFVASGFFEHRRFQKVLGAAAVALGAVIACLGVVFALDALQIRSQVQPAAALAFKVATGTAALKSMIGVLTLGAFGWAAFRAPKVKPVTTASRTANPLIVPATGSRPAAPTPRAPAAEMVKESV